MLLRDDVLVALAALSIAVELFLSYAFWVAGLRRVALAVGVGLHVGILVLFPVAMAIELGAFALITFALYPAFFGGSGSRPARPCVPRERAARPSSKGQE